MFIKPFNNAGNNANSSLYNASNFPPPILRNNCLSNSKWCLGSFTSDAKRKLVLIILRNFGNKTASFCLYNATDWKTALYIRNNIPGGSYLLKSSLYFFGKLNLSPDEKDAFRNILNVSNRYWELLNNNPDSKWLGDSLNMVVKDAEGLSKLACKTDEFYFRRQDAPKTYDLTTTGYITTPDYILNNNNLFDGIVGGYEIPINRSLDIDSEYDLMIARKMSETNE